MRRLRPIVALSVVALMTPMAAEITERMVGFLASSAHDEEANPDSCCPGPNHACRCCHTIGFVLPLAHALRLVPVANGQLPCVSREPRADGHAGGVFRPPIA